METFIIYIFHLLSSPLWWQEQGRENTRIYRWKLIFKTMHLYTQWCLNENHASILGCRVSLCSLMNGETSMHIQPYKDWDWLWSLLIYGDCWSLFHILITRALHWSDSAKSSGITEAELYQHRCNPILSFEIIQRYLIKTDNFKKTWKWSGIII